MKANILLCTIFLSTPFNVHCAEKSSEPEPLEMSTYYAQTKGEYNVLVLDDCVCSMGGSNVLLQECLNAGFSPDFCLANYRSGLNRMNHCFSPILCRAAANDAAPTKILLERNANVDAADYDGDTPLHCAVFAGKFDIATLLMRFNANPQVKNKTGKTPISMIYSLDSAGKYYDKQNHVHRFVLRLAKQKQRHDSVHKQLVQNTPLADANINIITYLAFGICANEGELSSLLGLYACTPKENVAAFDEEEIPEPTLVDLFSEEEAPAPQLDSSDRKES